MYPAQKTLGFTGQTVLLCAVLLLVWAPLLAQDDSANDRALPASRIISVLRSDHSLLVRSKQEFVSRAESQGQPVPPDLSDDAFFEIISRSSTVRAGITAELIKSGTIAANDPDLNNGVASASDIATQGALGTPGDANDPSGPDVANKRIAKTAPDSQDSQRERAKPSGDDSATPGQPRLSRKNSPYESIPALRDLYTQSVVTNAPLERFGATFFKTAAPNSDVDLPAGPEYVLGPGDGLELTMWGGVSRTVNLVVDREGRVALPDVGTMVLAGKTLGSAREAIQRALSNEYRNLNTDLALKRLRKIRIYIVGDVERPGAYDVSSLSSALNALYAAGGPTNEGSMRRIRQFREGKLVTEIDLYDFLLHGGSPERARLEPGDTIQVPPIGPQVTVSGAVRRPAIYELKDEGSLGGALDLAGGILVSGALSGIRVERVLAHQGRITMSANLPDAPADKQKFLADFKMQDGDRVVIAGIPAYADKTVYLEGHVQTPGKYSFHDGMKLTDIVKSYRDLMPEPSDHAEIVRLTPPDYHPVVLDFDLAGALAGKEGVELHPFDTVRIFGRYELDPPMVAVYGDVLRPGHYPLTNSMMVSDLLRMAGGFKRSAYTVTADLASYSVEGGEKIDADHRVVEIGKALSGVPDTDVRLKPGDVLTIRQLAGWEDVGGAVTIKGEVMHPGRYGIQQGERLSDILQRAGGFRESAYPSGAVLIRQQVKELDAANRDQLIRRIETSTAPTIRSTNPSEQAGIMTAFAAQQQQILKRLRDEPPVGRQIIRISSDLKSWVNTSADIELRPGDELSIPKRPGFVLVRGQVNNPAAITLTPGRNAEWYLKRAGGVTLFGSKKDAFIVRADGTVVGKQGSGLWSGSVLNNVLHPGDTLVVPERIFSESLLWKNLLSTAQVMSSIAVAARVATSF